MIVKFLIPPQSRSSLILTPRNIMIEFLTNFKMSPYNHIFFQTGWLQNFSQLNNHMEQDNTILIPRKILIALFWAEKELLDFLLVLFRRAVCRQGPHAPPDLKNKICPILSGSCDGPSLAWTPRAVQYPGQIDRRWAENLRIIGPCAAYIRPPSALCFRNFYYFD